VRTSEVSLQIKRTHGGDHKRRFEMNNPEILFKVAEARRKDLIKEAELHRAHQAWLKKQSKVSGPTFTLALMGTTIAAVLVSLVA
jgi:hypothetical protein